MASMITLPDVRIDDLYRVEGKAEIVNGKIIYLMVTGDERDYVGDEIFAWLRDYVKRSQIGLAIGDNKPFVVDLPHRKSLSPDAAYYLGPRTGMRFFEDWSLR